MQKTFFRHEYFGGLLYAQAIPGAVPIPAPSWSLIVAATNSAGASRLRKQVADDNAGALRGIVDQCVKFGALDRDLRVACEIFRAPYPIVRGILSAPLRVYLHITDRCNLHCDHCMFSCGRRPTTAEMSTDAVLRLLETLHSIRCPELRITGGEPTVREDTPSIIAEARRMGFYVMLNTNGVFDERTRERILAAEPEELIVSLDGSPERHDGLRGKGSFFRLNDNLRFMSTHCAAVSKRPHIVLNFTFGRHNSDDLEWVVQYAAQLGGDVNLMPLRPFGAAVCNLPQDMISSQDFLTLSSRVRVLREAPPVVASGIRIIHKNFDLESVAPDCRDSPPPFDRSSCGACSFGLGINPDGRANVCGFLSKDERFVGASLLDTPFVQVWYGPQIHAFRTVVKIRCESCRYYRRQCMGSCKTMALAAADGNWAGVSGDDPYCPFAKGPSA